MDDDLQKELYMPSGLKMKKEYFPGYGKNELIPTIVSGFIFLIIDSLLFLFGIRDILMLFLIPTVGVPVVVMLQVKGELNLSPVDIIKLEIQFRRSQKYYPYIVKNEWENIE